MIIRNVRLRNFRNYEKAAVTLNPSMNLITGQNAQGKTNLLESLVYLSLTRSHRISNDRKLIREGMPFADIACSFEDEGKQMEIEAIIHPQGKSLLANRTPVKRSSDFVGLLNVVLFSPDDLYLFNDQPRERRRIINQEITKVSPKYLLSLNRYQNYLRDRNNLLKQDRPDQTYLDILNEQMAEEEALIIAQRRNFISLINEEMPALYRELSADEIEVCVKYRCCTEETEHLKKAVLQMHRDSAEKDREYRTTTQGIHREDLIFEIDGKNVTLTASQGQKRMTMLAFKMALMRYIRKMTGKRPVLLLDDVLSELDRNRQQKLLEMVCEPYQCIITATEIPSFMKNRGFEEFRIENGTITKTGGMR